MKKLIVRLLAVFGGLVILMIGFGFAVGLMLWLAKDSVPDKTILEVNLETGLVEDLPDDSLAKVMTGTQPVLRDVVAALEKAGSDDRVVGLIARLGSAPMGMAQTQEIRDAVLRFRAQKKFAIAFAETFGEFGNGSRDYYLATAFDEIWLQPSGDVGLTGLIMESQFLKGTFDKLGIVPRGDHRYEYKNAYNTFTEKKFTQPHREAMEKVLNSWFAQMVRGIAEGRQLPEEQVRALIDRGPFLGKEALEVKLVDRLAYRDEAYSEVKKKAGDGAKLLYLAKYLERAGRPNSSGQTVALIYGVGGVERGKSSYDPVYGDVTMGSDTVAAAFRAAIEDKNVKAIIFRVDSPGGSAVASDVIWRETVRAKEAGKPVIVSMGDVAGSGGYWVAMSAEKIVAQPGTITGSIGVLGLKMLTTGFWDKLGISWDEVHAGANATMWTGTKDYTPAEWARFQASLDRIYEEFTSKVADGRRLPKERVLEIAKGRIWTGEDAKALGLVDEVGGLTVALNLAKEAAKIPAGDEVKLQIFPAKKNLIQSLLADESESSERDSATEALARTLRVIQPVARRIRALGLDQPQGAVRMPEVEPIR